jgi:hypothetical protein
MVFVFGIDIPLVELIFVLTLILVLLLAFLIYVVIIQTKLNKRLKEILAKENLELRGLQSIEEKETTEISLLNRILYGMLPGGMKKVVVRRRAAKKKRKKRRKPKKKTRRKPRKKRVVRKKTVTKKKSKKPKKRRRVFRNGKWVYVP